MERTYERWAAEVRQLLDGTAARKGYNQTGPDDRNALYEFVKEMNQGDGHALGEVVYKCRRFAALGNEEDLLKAAAWLFLTWRHQT